jgi:large subunit ribosomal protein L13
MKKSFTYSTKLSEINRKWFLVDAKGKTLGRLASRIAQLLSGKGKVIYTPHIDTGDFVIVINASDIKVTGGKETKKTYFTHSGYPGGDKLLNFKKMISIHPDKVIRNAVWGMLPQNRLGRVMLKKLKVYADAKHVHASQKPESINL